MGEDAEVSRGGRSYTPKLESQGVCAFGTMASHAARFSSWCVLWAVLTVFVGLCSVRTTWSMEERLTEAWTSWALRGCRVTSRRPRGQFRHVPCMVSRAFRAHTDEVAFLAGEP